MSSNQFVQLKLKLFYFVRIIRNSMVPFRVVPRAGKRKRREWEKARRAAETAKERQERLAKQRERDRARHSTETDNKSREREGLTRGRDR